MVAHSLNVHKAQIACTNHHLGKNSKGAAVHLPNSSMMTKHSQSPQYGEYKLGMRKLTVGEGSALKEDMAGWHTEQEYCTQQDFAAGPCLTFYCQIWYPSITSITQLSIDVCY